MQWLYDLGVLQFTRGFHEAPLKAFAESSMGSRQMASRLATTNARNAVRQFTQDGIASCIVYGHTHRGSVVDGNQIGVNGIKIVNNS